jgi:type IV pilus assembly protein PilV
MKDLWRSRGVSLIEVLIALVIVSIGLLGIAKMQALAIASTRGSSTRSLIAIEAASLAAEMHADRIYWSNVATAATTFSASVTTVNGVGTIAASTDSNLTTQSTNCVTNTCAGTGVALAAYDLAAWGLALNNIVNGATANVLCSGASVACTITVSWTENMVGMNTNTQWTPGNGTAQQTQTLNYALLVEP